MLKRDTTETPENKGLSQKQKPQWAEPETPLKQIREISTLNIYSVPLFQSEKRHRRETVPAISAEITPKGRHCLRGLDDKYGKWYEIGLFRKKRTETDPENDDDDDDEDEEVPEESGLVYETPERGGRYEPIRTDPENYALQKHTDGEIPQDENWKFNIRRSYPTEMSINRISTVASHIKVTFGCD